MTRWAILTGDYPPRPGGVSDYTRAVAEGLAALGDAVTVYAPAQAGGRDEHGVAVRPLPGRFGPRSLGVLSRAIAARPTPDRILIQYVPHAFGWKAMNLPFAAWVATQAARHAPVWVMFHEVSFPLSWRPPAHAILGVVTRVMARWIAGAAERVFVSIPAWGDILRKVCPRVRSPEWLPVPCVVGTAAPPGAVEAVRRHFPSGAEVVGHFGTFGGLIADILEPAASAVLQRRPAAQLLLIGRNSTRFRERLALDPALASRVHATGELPPEAVAAHLRACDVLLQPYPDGLTSRRTSAMAGLANGVPVVSNLGALSEPLWAGTDAVRVAPTPDVAALADAVVGVLDTGDRAALGARGSALYGSTFGIGHTLARLRP